MRLDVQPPPLDEGVQRPGRVQVVSSVIRGKNLAPGIHQPPFVWRDVVARAPPRQRTRGLGLHVTYHRTEHTGDVRISYATYIRVDPGADLASVMDDTIQVDERVCVQRRALQELIERERAFSDTLASRWRAGLARSLANQRRFANHLRAAWLIALVVRFLRLEARVGFAFIRGVRAFLRGLVALPDAVIARSISASTHLSTRFGRRDLWKGLRDPSGATDDEKGVVVVVVSALLVSLVLLLNTVFALFLPRLADPYGNVINDAALSLASVFILPLPPETLILKTTVAFGGTLAFLGVFLGKVAGSWLLYLVGDSLHDSLERQTRGRPRMGQIVAWIKARADSTAGAWALFLVNAVPFIPDVTVYAFAVSGMRFQPYMAALAAGAAAKYLAMIIAVYLVGPDVIRAFLENPFG